MFYVVHLIVSMLNESLDNILAIKIIFIYVHSPGSSYIRFVYKCNHTNSKRLD